MMNTDIIDNKEKHQYELHVGKYMARIRYNKNDSGEIQLTHTEVPAALQGQGIAGALAKGALTIIRQEGLAVIPICPFIIKYMEKNPEWKDIAKKDV